jgi:hypothetical protein
MFGVKDVARVSPLRCSQKLNSFGRSDDFGGGEKRTSNNKSKDEMRGFFPIRLRSGSE